MVKYVLLILTCMLGLTPTYAALLCDPVNVSNCAEVNSASTGGGLHTSGYAITGDFEGQKATYTLSSITLTAEGSASALPFFVLCGSDKKVVRVLTLSVNGTFATTAGRRAIALSMLYRSPITTNSGAVFPRVGHNRIDSKYGTMVVGDFFTNYSSADYVIGRIGIKVGNFQVTATPGAANYAPELEWDFRSNPIVLRGINYCVAMSFDTAPGTIPSVIVSGSWSEADK